MKGNGVWNPRRDLPKYVISAFEIKRDCANPEHAQGKKSAPTFTQFQCQRIKADPVRTNYSLRFAGSGNNNNNQGSGDCDLLRKGWREGGEQLSRVLARDMTGER